MSAKCMKTQALNTGPPENVDAAAANCGTFKSRRQPALPRENPQNEHWCQVVRPATRLVCIERALLPSDWIWLRTTALERSAA
jgi:hypothetical protein